MSSITVYPFWFDHPTVRNRSPSATIFDILKLMAPDLVGSAVSDELDGPGHPDSYKEDQDPRFKDYDSEVLDRKYIDATLVTPAKARLNPRTGISVSELRLMD